MFLKLCKSLGERYSPSLSGDWPTAVLLGLAPVEYFDFSQRNHPHEQLPIKPKIYSLMITLDGMFHTAMLPDHIMIESPMRAESWYPTVWLCVRMANVGSQENSLTPMAVAHSYT